jgi:hypothetical protein
MTFTMAAGAAGGIGVDRYDVVRAEAVKAAADQICGNWVVGRRGWGWPNDPPPLIPVLHDLPPLLLSRLLGHGWALRNPRSVRHEP